MRVLALVARLALATALLLALLTLVPVPGSVDDGPGLALPEDQPAVDGREVKDRARILLLALAAVLALRLARDPEP